MYLYILFIISQTVVKKSLIIQLTKIKKYSNIVKDINIIRLQ